MNNESRMGPKVKTMMSEKSAREIVKLDRIEQQIAPKDAFVMRLNRIFDAGLKFHESLWFARGQARIDLRENIKLYPEEFNAKQRSFALIINKALPTKMEMKVVKENNAVTPDQLEKAGLTMEQIRELAFPSEAQVIGEPDDAA
jgi:hypothetical protein